MLDYYAAKNRASRERLKLAAKPEVGVVFLINGHLYYDSTPVDEAETHGDFKGQESDHTTFWHQLQQIGTAPIDLEYDEVPRGRIGYNVKTRTFHLFLDKCIMENERLVDKIESAMHLPSKNLVVSRDSHYVCPGCRRPKKTKKQLQQEEEDWNF